VVVLDHPLIQRIEATLAAAPQSLLGLVLASASERAFIAGADLKAITELNDDQLHQYLRYGAKVFGMLAAFPFPTVAAINGATLGGGLEIAMHCDGLVACPPPMKDGQPGRPYPVGLPEAGLNICPGWGGTNLLPARIDAAEGIRRTALGLPMMFDEAKAAGMFDALAPSPASLLDTAKQWIVTFRAQTLKGGRIERDGAPQKWIGRPGRATKTLAALESLKSTLSDSGPQAGSIQAVIEAVDAGLAKGWQAALEVERRHLVHLRNQPAGKEAIGNFFAKSKK
jgi:enoyl-CoA hydratase/carnithine racemase